MEGKNNGVETGLGKLSTNPESPKKLPELQLTELARSKEPISGIIEDICSWKNYTIIVTDQKITVMNQDMEPVELNNSSVNINFSWDRLKTSRIQYISRDGRDSSNDEIYVSKLPFLLRKKGKDTVNDRSYVNMSSIPNIESKLVGIVELDKYLFFKDKEGSILSGFKLVNDEGIFLSPKNWEKLEIDSQIPKELEVEINKIEKENGEFKYVSNSCYILITDVGINIFRSENGNNSLVFSKNIPSVGKNITIDPNNPDIIYFCQGSNPITIQKINVSGDPSTWEVTSADFQNKYKSVSNLQLDPSGRFFLFYSKENLVIVSKDTLEEVITMPELSQVNFDESGHIRAIDKDGHLVIYEANFDELVVEIEKRKLENLANNVDVDDIFKKAAKKKETGDEDLHRLDLVKDQYQQKFSEKLKNINDKEGTEQARQTITLLRLQLKTQGLNDKEIEYIVSGLEKPVLAKEKEFATNDTEAAIKLIEQTLDIGLSISSVSEAKNIINQIRGNEALLDKDLRIKFSEISQKFDQKRLEFFTKQGDEVTKNLKGTVERIKTDLESFTSKAQMDDWLEFRYPELKLSIADLAKSVPVEANEAYKMVMAIRAELRDIVDKREEQFKLEYGKIREKAAERTEAVADTLKNDVSGFIERLKGRDFTSRAQAEQYLSSSEAKKALEEEINQMAGSDPDLAKKMMANFKVQISNALSELDRGGKVSVAETGQQMIAFGETLFPKWEAKVKQTTERKINLIFEDDIKSHGPGIKPTEFQGDVSIAIQNSQGKIDKVRLYEGWQGENEWRFGVRSYDKIGLATPPSFVTAEEFGKIRSSYAEWSKGNNSKLRKTLQEKQQALKEFYKTKPTNEGEMDKWVEKRAEKIKEYAAFYMENNIPLLKRIDQIKDQPEIEHSNGKGMVPEWQSHWTTDSDTEKNLEIMANGLKMQLELQEGCYNLKGHAGVGKDVLVKMFCNLTNRPYFGIDGSKWTTEFELSEDIVLESKDGASQTLRVPSAVLNGITTPGGVVYFNEFNAMPEQTQIFLHALMDEKRSLTLKTSSGKTVKALPTVLLVSSMNPNYPGTFDVQFATKSRMVDQNIEYPPLTRGPDTGDQNRNPLYNASEALRMAREIDSLDELTYEANIEHNDFVKMWDHYINGINNGSIEPNPTQRFDMETCLAIIQFTSKLREEFINYFEKTSGSRNNNLKVSQPITGRELRRMAYGLDQIEPERKATMDPDNLARTLLETYYLSHFDVIKDREQIKAAMSSWSSQKRVAK